MARRPSLAPMEPVNLDPAIWLPINIPRWRWYKHALFPNTVRKWRNTTTAQYHEIPEHLKQLISSGKNKTIIQIILQFISFPKTYYTNCILFHNICIPDLVAAHRENCKQLQRPTGREREIVLADVQDWAKFPEFQLSSQGTQGTNQSRYTKSSISG